MHQTPPTHRPPRRTPYVVMTLIACGVALLAGAVAVAALTGKANLRGTAPTPRASSPTPTPTPAETLAKQACRRAVRKQLKAPATARFSGEKVIPTDGQSFQVSGNVDSENSFGALIRDTYICHVDPDGTAHAFV